MEIYKNKQHLVNGNKFYIALLNIQISSNIYPKV